MSFDFSNDILQDCIVAASEELQAAHPYTLGHLPTLDEHDAILEGATDEDDYEGGGAPAAAEGTLDQLIASLALRYAKGELGDTSLTVAVRDGIRDREGITSRPVIADVKAQAKALKKAWEAKEKEKAEKAKAKAKEEATAKAQAETSGDSWQINGEWRVGPKGIFKEKMGADGSINYVLVTETPINVLGQARNADGVGWTTFVEISTPDGALQRLTFDNASLSTETKEVTAALAHAGAQILPGTDRDVCTYILSWPKPAIVRSVEHVGWYEVAGKFAFVLPDEVYGDVGEKLVPAQQVHRRRAIYERAGSLSQWKDKVSSYCGMSSRLTLAVSLAFAGPLTPMIGIPSGGFHIMGPSKQAKTLTSYMASTVWGDPRKFSMSWKATDNALEGQSAARNHTIVCMDELGSAVRGIGNTVYMLGNGQGKARAMSDGSTRNVTTWTVNILSNGELSLSQQIARDGDNAKAGQLVRIAEVPSNCGTGSIFERFAEGATFDKTAEGAYQACGEAYGWAGPEFVRRIAAQDDVAAFIEAVNQRVDDWLAQHTPEGMDSQSRVVTKRFAVTAVAGELATEWGITGWDEGDASDAAAKCLRDWYGVWKSGSPAENLTHEESSALGVVSAELSRVLHSGFVCQIADSTVEAHHGIQSDRSPTYRVGALVPFSALPKTTRNGEEGYFIGNVNMAPDEIAKAEREDKKFLFLITPKDFESAFGAKVNIESFVSALETTGLGLKLPSKNPPYIKGHGKASRGYLISSDILGM